MSSIGPGFEEEDEMTSEGLVELGVCLMRPAGSAVNLIAMLAFVVGAWVVRPRAQGSSSGR
jgi:hypothetical protein